MPNTEILDKKKIKTNNNWKEPPLYRVIYINDDVTTVEFVVFTLTDLFDYDEIAATEKAREIDQQGSAVVAVYPYEIAEQKGTETVLMARKNGYPLNLKLEPEE